MLNEILLHILNNYPTEKGKSSQNDPLATYFRQDFKKKLQELVDTNIFKSKTLFEEAGFEVLKIWTTNDVRKGREHELWLNILVRKWYQTFP